MTDEEQRMEWQRMRDAMIARLQHDDPSISRELALESIALTFWNVIADRIEPDGTYTGPNRLCHEWVGNKCRHCGIRYVK